MKKDFVPILLSLALVISSIFVIIVTDNLLSVKHYIGMSLLLISIISYYAKPGWYVYIFGLTLLLGLVGLIDFFYISFSIGISGVGVNPIFIVLLIIFVAVYRHIFFPENTTEGSNEPTEKQIELFRKKLALKTESDLKEIAKNDSSYVEAARMAARELLKENNVL